MSLVLCSGFSLEFFHWLWSAIARHIFCLIYCHLSQSNTQYKNTKKMTVYHMKIIQIGISQIQHCTSLCDLSVGFALPSTSHFFLDPIQDFFLSFPPSLLPRGRVLHYSFGDFCGGLVDSVLCSRQVVLEAEKLLLSFCQFISNLQSYLICILTGYLPPHYPISLSHYS